MGDAQWLLFTGGEVVCVPAGAGVVVEVVSEVEGHEV